MEILKLVEDPEPHLLELLHTICEKTEYKERDFMDSVLVGCSLHPAGHKVNTVGFELLESVEGAMGTTLQKIQQFDVDNFNNNNKNMIHFPFASAARINRQNEPLKRVNINGVTLSANTGIITALLQNAEEWEIKEFTLERDFGEAGWSWLAENLRKNKDPFHTIWLSKVVMARAKREDLKAIWDQNPGCQWWLEEHSPGPGPLPIQWKNTHRLSQL